jgi:N-acetylglucosaminyl-diphospho-decaprenol L-rhamnosyltransferase
MSLRLAIVVLNYRTAALTTDCLQSIAPQREPGMAVVVVDNDSGDGSADALVQWIAANGHGDWMRVLRAPRNGGFAAGNNLGLAAVDAERYVLLNSDTRLLPGALRALQDAADRSPQAGIFGPRMVDEHGAYTPSHFRFPNPIHELIRAANTGPVTRLLRRWDVALPDSDQPAPAAWVGFAGVLIRREVLAATGPLDEGYFMYFEDADFCRRARDRGFAVLYWPASRIVHLLGRSSGVTGATDRRRRPPRYYYASRARYFRRHHGRLGIPLANLMWYLGFLVSCLRMACGRPPTHRVGEARDLWIRTADAPTRPPASPS